MQGLSAALKCVLLSSLMVCAGCGPSGAVTLIPLSTTRLDLEGPLAYELHPRACWWWEDEDGRINVAMAVDRPSALGDYTRDAFVMSLVLQEPPAGEAREYRCGRDTMRGLWQRGAFHLRLASTRGLILLLRDGTATFRGRMRMHCATRKFEVLSGWTPQARVLVQGEFTARHNPDGQALLERSEAGHPRRGSTGATFTPGG